MLDPTTPDTATSWRASRALRRGAGTLGAAVVLATVGPAIANAAGADVANPVAVALRASGKSLASAFSTADDEPNPCVTPSTEPTEGTEVTASPTADPSASASVEPVVTPSGTPDDTLSADPASSSTEMPTALPSETDDDCDDEATPTPAASEAPSASPSETPEDEETEEAEDADHGQLVSTVAKCAPHGKDPLLDVEGAPSNHGGYVKPAAHGDTLTLPWGTYDLSTQAGADDLCASLDAARADLADEAVAPAKGKADKGKAAKAKHAKPGHGGKGGNGGNGGKRRGHGRGTH